MIGVESSEVQQHLEAADAAYRASVVPRLPAWAVVACGALTGTAVALSGQYSPDGTIRALYLIAAVLLAAAAAALFLGIRRRRGLTGFRGPAREEAATLLTAAIALFVCALSASAEFRWIYVGLGVAAAVLVTVALWRRQSR